MHTVQIVGDESDLLELEKTIQLDSELRGLKVERLIRPPDLGELGPTTEALRWVSDNQALLGAAFVAVAAWARGRRSRVRVKIGDREAVVDSARIDDPDATAQALIEMLKDD